MPQKPKLIFFCGKMGAGKTTLSKRMASEHSAVRLSEDEWLAAHYSDQITGFDDYIKYSRLIKPFVRSLVAEIVGTNTNVVMDFPGNTIKQRAWFTDLCQELGCDHELVYLNVSNERCLAQIEKRREEQPERRQFDTETLFHEVTKYFEAPTADEQLNIVEFSK